MAVESNVCAEVELVPSEQGGRGAPLLIGYRPQFHMSGATSDYAMTILELSPHPMHPGQSGTIGFDLLQWEKLRPNLSVGMNFKIREGYRVIAHGVITRLTTASSRG